MRPTRTLTPVYGMSIAGEAGVRHVMRSLLADFDILMNCAGVNRIEDITVKRLSESPTHIWTDLPEELQYASSAGLY